MLYVLLEVRFGIGGWLFNCVWYFRGNGLFNVFGVFVPIFGFGLMLDEYLIG